MTKIDISLPLAAKLAGIDISGIERFLLPHGGDVWITHTEESTILRWHEEIESGIFTKSIHIFHSPTHLNAVKLNSAHDNEVTFIGNVKLCATFAPK